MKTEAFNIMKDDFARLAEFVAERIHLLDKFQTEPRYTVLRSKRLNYVYPDANRHVVKISEIDDGLVPSNWEYHGWEYLGTLAVTPDVSKLVQNAFYSKGFKRFLVKTFEVDRLLQLFARLIQVSGASKYVAEFGKVVNQDGETIGTGVQVIPSNGVANSNSENGEVRIDIDNQDMFGVIAADLPGLLLQGSKYEYAVINVRKGLLNPVIRKEFASELGFTLFILFSKSAETYHQMWGDKSVLIIQADNEKQMKRTADGIEFFENLLEIKDKYKLHDVHMRYRLLTKDKYKDDLIAFQKSNGETTFSSTFLQAVDDALKNVTNVRIVA